MAKPDKVAEAVKKYSVRQVVYTALALKVEEILRDIMSERSLNYHSISSRGKEVATYEKKARDGKYSDPERQIMDMAGVRVITYTQSDAEIVSSLVKELFDIMPEHSMDKAEELGTDRVGYRSIHFVGTLGTGRLSLPENRMFDGMPFEIQVRTILQHAWAEFEHSRNYKFAGVLPSQLKRRVSLLSGNLELIDREFDSIAHAIDEYAGAVDKKTEAGELDVPIDSTSLAAFLKRRFGTLIDEGVIQPTFNNTDKELVEELREMGIRTLKGLNAMISPKFEEAERRAAPGDNLTGLVRNIMIIHDADGYFRKAWKRHWDNISPEDVELYREFGIDVTKYARELDIYIGPETR